MKENKKLERFFYVQESSIHGKGLFARTSIEDGCYLGTYAGYEAEDDGMHVLWAEMEDGEWKGIDGKNMLRYLNHSAEPCAEFCGFELYAIRDIAPDEEITIHYGEEFASEV